MRYSIYEIILLFIALFYMAIFIFCVCFNQFEFSIISLILSFGFAGFASQGYRERILKEIYKKLKEKEE